MVVIFDVETRSELNLKKVGNWIYSLHPSTEILCLAYKIDDGETKVIDFRELSGIPGDFAKALDSGATLEAFNAEFEYAIYRNILSERHNWPEIDVSKFICSQARAFQFSLPRSLEDVSAALQIGVEKDMDGRRIMLQMCKPKKPSKKDPSLWYDDDERYQKLMYYCMRDVDVTYEIRKKLLRMTKDRNYFTSLVSDFKNRELEIYRMNNEINLRGVQCNTKACANALTLIHTHEDILNTELAGVTDGRINTTGQVKEIVTYFHENEIHIPNIQSKTIEEWKDRVDGKFKRILEIRQQLSKTSTKKIQAMLDKSDSNGRIRNLLTYYGASRTGRFSGSGIQVQNFARPSLIPEEIEIALDMLEKGVVYDEFLDKFPNVLDAISSCLRGLLIPKEDHVFLDSDFAAIEARVLFWLAEENIGLEMYKQGIDIYKDMASTIYDKPLEEITKDLRQLGKQAILGCGYGMGAEKFMKTCLGYGMEVSEELASRAVSSYREKFENVKKFWYDMEEAAVKSILNPGKKIKARLVDFYTYNHYMFLCLPSGRALAYNQPMVKPRYGRKFEITYKGYNSQIAKFEEQRTWGGKLVENITQAVARDFMAEAMLRINDKYPVVFTVHDQILSEVPENSADIEDFNKLMEVLPRWGEGCPIVAETQICKRFKK